MNHDKLLNNEKGSSFFGAKIKIENSAGRFTLRTLSTMDELSQAFQLRYQVFQVEMGGGNVFEGRDHDEFDWVSDHIGIFDSKSDQMIATCRLNCSLFSNKFYSEQEFNCSQLIQQPQTKLEIGRVCVRREFRKGIVIMLLWRAIAQYMNKSQARFLFGCGSVATLDPTEAFLLYHYLEDEKKVRSAFAITPTEKYRSVDFEKKFSENRVPLSDYERDRAKQLLPSLCRSYFDIGCFTPGLPAFDFEFKCIDFLTILDVNELHPQIRRKMLGEN